MESILIHNSIIKELTIKFKVPYLYFNLSLILLSCLSFFCLEKLSNKLSPKLFPNQFKVFSSKTKKDWDLHFTGWIHALIATPLAFKLILNPSPELILDPIFGYSSLEGAVYGFSFGYFLYDLIVSLYYVRTHGLPFVAHAMACCFIFFKAFTPFLMGIGSMFLIWEFSTVFLHIHWYLDKVNMTGSKIQLVNGVCLMLSFFGTRIVYGAYQSYILWNLLDSPSIHPYMKWGFRSASLVLGVLNWSWFRLMVISVTNRFKAATPTGSNAAERVLKKSN